MSDLRPDSDPSPRSPLQHRKIYRVSELTTEIKSLLEDRYPFVWITGEISNFRLPASGHYYFSLKDEKSQINAVMFRGQHRNLTFVPEDGMLVTGLGRISVFEPRGTYQVILEYLEPEGVGAIQIAFEQLKARLSDEGLFDEKFKQPLPYLPQRIGIITSPSGAVVHDILNILDRRYPNLAITIYPVRVQGAEADVEIAAAIRQLNERADADVAILARGGGSLEDLAAFNSEAVARAIFSSGTPIISAVGHETDYTIADFVADLRAPTPSAAAELVIAPKADLVKQCDEISNSLVVHLQRFCEQLRMRLDEGARRLVDPRRKVEDLRLRVDDLSDRMTRSLLRCLEQERERLGWRTDRLLAGNPTHYIRRLNETLEGANSRLYQNIQMATDRFRYDLREMTAKLTELSPKAILSRGYSITRTIPHGRIIKDPASVDIDQDLEVMVERGEMIVRVMERNKRNSGGKL